MRRSIAYRDGTLDPGPPADPEPACLRVLQDRGWVPLGWLRTTQRERPRTPPTRPLDARDRVWRSPDRSVLAQVGMEGGELQVDLWSLLASGRILLTRWRDASAGTQREAGTAPDTALRAHARIEETLELGTLDAAVHHHGEACARRVAADGVPLELDVAGLAAVQARRDDVTRGLTDDAKSKSWEQAFVFWCVVVPTVAASIFALVLLVRLELGWPEARVSLVSSAGVGCVAGMIATAISLRWQGAQRLFALAAFGGFVVALPPAVEELMSLVEPWSAAAGVGLGVIAGTLGTRINATWWPTPPGTRPAWLPRPMEGAEILLRYGPRLDGQLGCVAQLSAATTTPLDGFLAGMGFRAVGERWVAEAPLHLSADHWSPPPVPRTLAARVWFSLDDLIVAEPSLASDGQASLVFRSHARGGRHPRDPHPAGSRTAGAAGRQAGHR